MSAAAGDLGVPGSIAASRTACVHKTTRATPAAPYTATSIERPALSARHGPMGPSSPASPLGRRSLQGMTRHATPQRIVSACAEQRVWTCLSTHACARHGVRPSTLCPSTRTALQCARALTYAHHLHLVNTVLDHHLRGVHTQRTRSLRAWQHQLGSAVACRTAAGCCWGGGGRSGCSASAATAGFGTRAGAPGPPSSLR